jgi:hypothetical protein
MHYTPHQAVMNAFAAAICGFDPRHDIAANRNKAEKAQAHDLKLAMREQINWESKAGAP